MKGTRDQSLKGTDQRADFSAGTAGGGWPQSPCASRKDAAAREHRDPWKCLYARRMMQRPWGFSAGTEFPAANENSSGSGPGIADGPAGRRKVPRGRHTQATAGARAWARVSAMCLRDAPQAGRHPGLLRRPRGDLAAATTPSQACEEAASWFSALLHSWPQGVSPSPCGEALRTLGPPVDPLSLLPLLQELRSETAPEGLQTFLW